jgi:hypothetical protein
MGTLVKTVCYWLKIDMVWSVETQTSALWLVDFTKVSRNE